MKRSGFLWDRLFRVMAWSLVALSSANLIVELTGFYIWQPFTHPFETARIAEAWATFPESEIVLLGSSLVQNGLVPATIMEELGKETGQSFETYNLGIFGGGAGGMASFLGAATRHLSPRLIVYGTTQQECRVAEGFDRMRYYRAFASPFDVLRNLVSGRHSFSELRLQVSTLFKPVAIPAQTIYELMAESLAHLLGLPPTRFQTERSDARRGRGWNAIGNEKIRGSWRYHEVRIDWSALQRLHESSRRLGSTLVILYMPEDLAAVPGKEQVREEFARELKAFCAERSIPYFDLNEAGFAPVPEDFAADGRHLLARGAKRLSRHLARAVFSPLLSGHSLALSGQDSRVGGRRRADHAPLREMQGSAGTS